MYVSTVEMIKSIVHWLEGTDDEKWQDHAVLAQNAIADAQRMATPTRRPDKGPVQMVPGDRSMQMALPHLQKMLEAMYAKNRTKALQQGKAALNRLGIDVLSEA